MLQVGGNSWSTQGWIRVATNKPTDGSSVLVDYKATAASACGMVGGLGIEVSELSSLLLGLHSELYTIEASIICLY